jgi:hypothetical protein
VYWRGKNEEKRVKNGAKNEKPTRKKEDLSEQKLF